MNLRLPLVLSLAGGSRRPGDEGQERQARGRDEYRERRRDGDGGDESSDGPTVPWPDRRKRVPRREDDLDEAQLRGWGFWAKVMFVHRAKLIIFSGFASGALGYLGATVGIQRRVSNLETITSATATRVSALEDAEPVKLYILCSLLAMQPVPTQAVPRTCDDVLSAGAPPSPQPARKLPR